MGKYETPWEVWAKGHRPSKARQQIFSKSDDYVCEAITLPVAERIVRALNRDELFEEMENFFREAAALGDCQDPNIGPEGGSDCEVCATCCGKYFLAKIDALKGDG